jgi:hypothetical protein
MAARGEMTHRHAVGRPDDESSTAAIAAAVAVAVAVAVAGR